MKRGDKKAQIKLSFGMIFSIILIIFFIAFAFFGIKKFLGIQEVTQIETFKSDLQNDINKIWTSTQGSQEVKYVLPGGVEKVCFRNDENENLFFEPNKFNGGKIKYIDFEKTLDSEEDLCISVLNKKITMTLKKNYGEIKVTITK